MLSVTTTELFSTSALRPDISITRSSHLNYTYTFKGLLFRHVGPDAQDIHFSHFRHLYRQAEVSKNRSQRSSIKYYYGNFSYLMLTVHAVGKYSFLNNCYEHGIQRLDKLQLLLAPQETFDALFARFERGEVTNQQMEEAFCLPEGILNLFGQPENKRRGLEQSAQYVQARREVKPADRPYFTKFAHYYHKSMTLEEAIERAVSDIAARRHKNRHLDRVRAYGREHPLPRINLEEHMAEEWAALLAYRTTPNRRGRREWNGNTPATMRKHYEKIFAYAVAHLGVPLDQLSFALLLDPRVTLGCIEYCRMAADGYNTTPKVLFSAAMHMLNKKRGWLRNDTNLKAAGAVGSLERQAWQAACDACHEVLSASRDEIALEWRDLRRSKDYISPLVDADAPLDHVFDALDYCRRRLLSQQANTKVYAFELQNYVFMFLLACFPLRAKNWTLIKYDPYLVHPNSLHKSPDGKWLLDIRTRDLKNYHKNKDLQEIETFTFYLGYRYDLQPHFEMLDLFINKYRAMINQTDYLFCTYRGKQVGISSFFDMSITWTEKYLSMFSEYPTGIDRVAPFGTHLMRTIVATHYCNRGEISLAALLLLDTETVIRRHYLRKNLVLRLKGAWIKKNET